jgi:8-oxo-dGTP pyrophosphatase MutT (NUDIX family)
MPRIKHKVFAYITQGERLLVFRHADAPEAGIQVPAGTVEPGESFDAAVLREAYEETGLQELTLVAALGDRVRDMSDCGLDEIHHRHFFHVRYTGAPLETWCHNEVGSDGTAEPIRFEFFWADLPHGVPDLIGGHGALLDTLNARPSSAGATNEDTNNREGDTLK